MSLACSSPLTATALDFVHSYWIPVFGVLSTILVDHRSYFVSNKFRQYVVSSICAYLVFTSYPQENGINEACHLSLEHGLKVASVDPYGDFAVVLQDVTLVQNSILFVDLGQSPFFLLFGLLPTFPGWQRFKPSIDEPLHAANRQEARHRLLIRCELVAWDAELTAPPVQYWPVDCLLLILI